MVSISARVAWTGAARTCRGDALMVVLAVVHGAVLLARPTAVVIAVGVWWNSNTIAHNFIHRPFFSERPANRLFAAYLSVLLGVPQSLWRDRHLAHHSEVQPRWCLCAELVVQTLLVLSLWVAIAVRDPLFFLSVYVPGFIGGLILCGLHGYYEHAHSTTSHYGKLYNLLFFNDGYHVEHHAHPEAHWTDLPSCQPPADRASTWPAPLRWLDDLPVRLLNLQTLERLVLRSRVLQQFVLHTHARALSRLVVMLPPVEHVAIVGGGLFPRTALVLRRLLPTASITIIDASRANLDRARALLAAAGLTVPCTAGSPKVEFVHAHFPESEHTACDLLVIPLSFDGNRSAIYRQPPAPAVAVHDWIWRARGASSVVSILLLKRINLVRP